MFGLFALELNCRRTPRMTRSRTLLTSPRPQISNEVNERGAQAIPPQRLTSAASWLISSIHDFRSKTDTILWLRRLQHWHAEKFLRAIAVPEANATARHGDLHDVVPALTAKRAAKAGRGGAEYLQASARFFFHCLPVPGRPLLRRRTSRPGLVGGQQRYNLT